MSVRNKDLADNIRDAIKLSGLLKVLEFSKSEGFDIEPNSFIDSLCFDIFDSVTNSDDSVMSGDYIEGQLYSNLLFGYCVVKDGVNHYISDLISRVVAGSDSKDTKIRVTVEILKD